MATTISNATMTVTVTESVSLNGSQQGATNTLTLSNIDEIYKRIVTVPNSEVELIAFSTAIATGTFDEDDVRYIRITNKDDANHVWLTFKNENADEFLQKIDKGQSFIFNGDIATGVVDRFDATSATGADRANVGDLVNITAFADTAAVDVEIFVACV